MKSLELNIIPDNINVWSNHPTYDKAFTNEDCGLDIPMANTVIVPKNSKSYTVDLGFKAEQNHAYMLVPRSSISKTPLRLGNSIGIIDTAYRGKVMLKLDNNSNIDFTLNENSCYFQIIAFDGNLPSFNIVKEISFTLRADGAFGSTTS